MFLRRGKSTEGWAAIGFGVFASVFSLLGLSGAFGPPDDSGRGALLVFLGIPIGVAMIIGGIVSLYRDGRRPES
jgi:hypothetical protein